MENEKLKEIVWAKCEELAPEFKLPHQIRDKISLVCHADKSGFDFWKVVGDRMLYPCRIERDMPADSSEWWIAAKLLDIPTEAPIEIAEVDIAASQYQHYLDQARRQGFEDAKAQKLTSPEQELCAIIRDGLGKFMFTAKNDEFTVSLNSGRGMDATAFGRLFDRVMMGRQDDPFLEDKPNLSADASNGDISQGMKSILDGIVAERKRQDAKWGANRNLHPYHWNTILGEEVGEVNQASFDADKDPAHLLEELEQVAAVSVAYAECVKRKYNL